MLSAVLRGTFVVLVFCALSACAQPSLPVLYPAAHFSGTYFIGQEGVTAAFNAAFNITAGMQLINHTSTNGYFGVLVRGDKGVAFMFWVVNGTPTCLGYPAVFDTSKANAPTPLKYNFVRQTLQGNGDLTNVFRAVEGRYLLTIESDAVTGLPLRQNDVFETVVTFGAVYNNTPAPPGTFDIPSYCNAAEMASEPEAEAMLRRANRLLAVPLKSPHSSRGDLRRRPHQEQRQRKAANVHAQGHRLPATLDNRRFATPIRDQSQQCGCCWAMSSAALIETVVNYKGGRDNRTVNDNNNVSQWVSVQALIDCATGLPPGALFATKGCWGGWPATALQDVVNHGIVPEAVYPYTAVNGRQCLRGQNGVGPVSFPLRSTTTIRAPQVEQMKAAIAANGAIVAIVAEITSSVYYGGGVYNDPACTPALDHGVLIVGWGVDKKDGNQAYWIVKNSFGSGWGEGGYIRIALGINMCGIEDWAFVAVAA